MHLLKISFYERNLNLSKLQSIQERAAKIASSREMLESWDSIVEVRNRRVTIDIFTCINGLEPEHFTQYFYRQQHGKDTRAKNSKLVLLPI